MTAANKLALCDHFSFRGNCLPVETGTASESPFRKKTVGSAAATGDAGGLKLSLEATDEAQNLCLYFDNILSYDLDKLISIEVWGTFEAVDGVAGSSIAIGMASARNDAIDSIAHAAMFRIENSLDLFLESDDAVNDVDDIDSGLDLVSGELWQFGIYFTEKVKSVSPGPSLGKQVNFRAGKDQLKEVGSTQSFDMSNYSGGLQPFIQVQKPGGDDVVSFTVRDIFVKHQMN